MFANVRLACYNNMSYYHVCAPGKGGIALKRCLVLLLCLALLAGPPSALVLAAETGAEEKAEPPELVRLTRVGATLWFALSAEAPAGTKLAVAAYDPVSGRLLGLTVLGDLTAESLHLDAPEDAAVRGYLLDRDGRPLCEPRQAERW